MLQFTAIFERSQSKLWGHQIRVPDSVVRKLIDGKSRRIICSLKGTPERQCALLPIGGGAFAISINKEHQRLLDLTVGMRVKVRVRKDRSTYGLPMPEELKELLRQDREGNKLFHALTAGKQRTLLFIIGSKGDSERRLRRAVTVIRHLTENGGDVNYRQLSILLRREQSAARRTRATGI